MSSEADGGGANGQDGGGGRGSHVPPPQPPVVGQSEASTSRFDEEQVQKDEVEDRRQRLRTAAKPFVVAAPTLPMHTIGKPISQMTRKERKIAEKQMRTAGSQSSLHTAPPPDDPQSEQSTQSKRQKYSSKSAKSSKAAGHAEVVRAAAPRLSGHAVSVYPGIIGYPRESLRVEPISVADSAHLPDLPRAIRKEREAGEAALWMGPIPDILPDSTPLGYGAELEATGAYEMLDRKALLTAGTEDRQSMEAAEYQYRREQVIGSVSNDENLCGNYYDLSSFDQLPYAARELFGYGLSAHKSSTDVLENRAKYWTDFNTKMKMDILATTGKCGPWSDTNDGTHFVRSLIVAVTTQHVQVAAYGRNAIASLNREFTFTPSELNMLEDRMALKEVVRGSLLASIERHFKDMLPHHPRNWQQSLLVGTYVDARVSIEAPSPGVDPNAGRIYRVHELQPVVWEPRSAAMEEDVLDEDVNTDEARERTAASAPMLIAEPDMGLATMAVVQCLRTEEEYASGRPTSSFEWALHLGIPSSGPVGVSRHQFVDALATGEVDFSNPTKPDVSALVEGSIVACIGVQPQEELDLRGMKAPRNVPQIVQFAAVPPDELERMVHVQPEYFTQLNLVRQHQFLRFAHSLQLAVTAYHRHLEMVHYAKGRVVARVLSLDLYAPQPLITVSLPVTEPLGVEIDRRMRLQIKQNEMCRVKEDDLVRVLFPSRLNLKDRDRDEQAALLAGSKVAWEQSFVCRCVSATLGVGQATGNTSRLFIFEFAAADRSRLRNTGKESRKSIVFESLSREMLTEVHFVSNGSSEQLSRMFLGIHSYADLSRQPDDQPFTLGVLWQPPFRTECEGLCGEVDVPVGRTNGNGAVARSTLGLQQDQNEVVPMRADMTMRNLGQQLFESRSSPDFLKLDLKSEIPGEPHVTIRPSVDELNVAVQLLALQSNLVKVVGGEGSGKTTLLMMLTKQYILHEREPFRGGTIPRPAVPRVMIVSADVASADAATRLAIRMASCQPKGTLDANGQQEYYSVTDRENPISILRFCGERPMGEWDSRGDIHPESIAHVRLDSRLKHSTMPAVPEGSLVSVLSPHPALLAEMFAEYARKQGLERGVPVHEVSYPPPADDPYFNSDSYEEAFQLWHEVKGRYNDALSDHSSHSGHSKLAFECEKAHFVAAVHAMCRQNANVFLCTAADLRNPMLRCMGQFSIVMVDDAQCIPFSQMMAIMEFIHMASWQSPRTQLVMTGNDSGRLAKSFAKGDAFALRRLSLFTAGLRALRLPIFKDRPHSRLSSVHRLDMAMRVPQLIGDWAETAATGTQAKAPPANVKPPVPMPKFIRMAMFSAILVSNETIELIDMQSATQDLEHPMFGRINAVQHVYLITLFSMLTRDKSYQTSSVMVVMATLEAAHFLRSYVAHYDQLKHFPPIFSYEESHGHSADLVIIGATTMPDPKWVATMLRSGDEGAEALSAHYGWLNHPRSLLDVIQRARHKVAILAHADSMAQLKSGMWRSLQQHCAVSDSFSTANYRTMEGRAKQSGLKEAALHYEQTMMKHLSFAGHAEPQQVVLEMEASRNIETLNPIHPCMPHTLFAMDERRMALTEEARYYKHLRRVEGRCIEWRAAYEAERALMQMPKEPVEASLSELEKKDGLFVDLGTTYIFHPTPAPEMTIFEKIVPAPEPAEPMTLETGVSEETAAAVASIAVPVSQATPSHATEPPADVPMGDLQARKKQEAYDAAMSRYAGSRENIVREEGEVSTPSAGGTSTSATPSSANFNVSSVSPSSLEKAPRGSYLSGSAISTAAQLTNKAQKTRSVEARRTAASAPAMKKPRVQDVGAEEASAVSAFPGSVLNQGSLMPPPRRPTSTSGKTRSISRSERPSRSGGASAASSRQHSKSPSTHGRQRSHASKSPAPRPPGHGREQSSYPLQAPPGEKPFGYQPYSQDPGVQSVQMGFGFGYPPAPGRRGAPRASLWPQRGRGGRGQEMNRGGRGGRPTAEYRRGGRGQQSTQWSPIRDQASSYQSAHHPPVLDCERCGSLQHDASRCMAGPNLVLPCNFCESRNHVSSLCARATTCQRCGSMRHPLSSCPGHFPASGRLAPTMEQRRAAAGLPPLPPPPRPRDQSTGGESTGGRRGQDQRSSRPPSAKPPLTEAARQTRRRAQSTRRRRHNEERAAGLRPPAPPRKSRQQTRGKAAADQSSSSSSPGESGDDEEYEDDGGGGGPYGGAPSRYL